MRSALKGWLEVIGTIAQSVLIVVGLCGIVQVVTVGVPALFR